jgi:anhydro-N-acetylmuramic acid kinase
MKKKYNIIGIMSGTSMDGVDVASLITDGETIYEFGSHKEFDYSNEIKQKLSAQNIDFKQILLLEYEVTNFYKSCLLDYINHYPKKYDCVALHGQTLDHRPDLRTSWQLLNPHVIAEAVEFKVMADFRRKDMAYGGEGAPLVPIFHRQINQHLQLCEPSLWVNIGGICNITYINNNQLIAADIGPGNCIINDLCKKFWQIEFDYNGEIARNQPINYSKAEQYLEHMKWKFPFSLDRKYFVHLTNQLEKDDIGTATFLTAKNIARNLANFAEKPKQLVLCGGGANNKYLSELINDLCQVKCYNAEDFNLNNKAMESYAFALIAARSLNKLPSTFKMTTGVKSEVSCGVVYE